MIDFAQKFRSPPPDVWLLAPQHADAALYSAYSRQRSPYRAAPMRMPSAPSNGQHVAVISVRGVISHHDPYIGTPTSQISRELDQAIAAASVKMILLDCDSYGGGIHGVPELVDQVYAARQQKTIVAIANSMAGCAAYWIASAADMLFCTPSGAVGGLGCVKIHVDESKMLEKEGLKISLVSAGRYKTEGHPFEPPSDHALEHMQQTVDDYYRMMVKSIARNRGVSTDKVHTGYGEGRMVLAKDALKAGIVDGVLSQENVLVAIARTLKNETARARSEAWKTTNRIAEIRKTLDEISRN